jgi:hypothetical protein
MKLLNILIKPLHTLLVFLPTDNWKPRKMSKSNSETDLIA